MDVDVDPSLPVATSLARRSMLTNAKMKISKLAIENHYLYPEAVNPFLDSFTNSSTSGSVGMKVDANTNMYGMDMDHRYQVPRLLLLSL
jgi:hypothetical protein